MDGRATAMGRSVAVRQVIVRLENVTQRYRRAVALDDVTVSLPAACIVGLIGPDGVGKSTLLSMIAGTRQLQSGRVFVLDGDMRDARHRANVCRRIAFMPQGLGKNLYPDLSVRENIDFFGRLFGQSRTERHWRISELQRSTGLAPFAKRPAKQLSGGMRQKLGLCCSLIHDPDLLILDEPTTGLDPLSKREFWELIERIRLRRPGISIVIATAYMEEAERCDWLLAMNGGKILATGSPANLKAQTQTANLEDAFVALLPTAADHTDVQIPPRRFLDAEPVIMARDLARRFGDFIAVDRVSFTIERGEIFGFVGSNGCGKTTTMKMLTGLLAPSEGDALLFGKPLDPSDINSRRRVGYMSQSFSLYTELTVRQNLELHARLFHLPAEQANARLATLIDQFGLKNYVGQLAADLPLGIRQRLSLAVAVVHEPEMLILDEPTSGVDPLARDKFWELLIDLSRNQGVTIFVSTHLMKEAERCDRVSLMHAGRILAVDTPQALQRARGASSLEEAFVGYLKDAARAAGDLELLPQASFLTTPTVSAAPRTQAIELRRLWAFVWRESLELSRDPIRIAFALLGPLILAIAMVFGISFDIENVRYTALDQDQSRQSRILLQNFSGSRYFQAVTPISTEDQIERGLARGDFNLAVEIPPSYGRKLLAGRRPEVGVWLDGSNTFRAEAIRGYVQGVIARYLEELARGGPLGLSAKPIITIESRFRYNQAFLSRYAISPGILMMILIMFSTMLTALGIVREKELGSITNFYATPVRKLEFLIGKQLPYVAVGFLTFAALFVMINFGFDVPITGSFLTLAFGALLYSAAATAFGLVLSAFVRSQIAAIFGSAIVVMVPTLNFSGMIYPVSTLDGPARLIGVSFPAVYFQRISSGVFNKGLSIDVLWVNHLTLAAFCVGFVTLAAVLLKKQEA